MELPSLLSCCRDLRFRRGGDDYRGHSWEKKAVVLAAVLHMYTLDVVEEDSGSPAHWLGDKAQLYL